MKMIVKMKNMKKKKKIISIGEKSKNVNNDLEKPAKFFKIEMKELKEDSAVLENDDWQKDLGIPKVKQKKKLKINFANHFLYLFKSSLRLKLNKNDLKYKYLDIGYSMLMNGIFIYKKIQELELFKKIKLSENEISLMHILKKPSLNLNSEYIMKISTHFKNFEI